MVSQARSVRLLLRGAAGAEVERQTAQSVWNEQTASADVGGLRFFSVYACPSPNAAELERS